MDKPFSKAFVMKTTVHHMKRSIDISIRKTLGRLGDFEGDAEKGLEILATVRILNDMRANIERFEELNPSLFEDN